MAKTKSPKKLGKSADKLINTTEKDDIELIEEDLAKVSGGAGSFTFKLVPIKTSDF